MNHSADKSNLHPNYQFILDNLNVLTTEISYWNVTKKFPTRSKFSIPLNIDLVNLKRQILMDIADNEHRLILFNSHQWQQIKNTLKSAETENV